MHPSQDPKRQRLKLEDWPEGDRAAWAAALVPGDFLDGTMGPGHHWSEATRDLRRKAYGRWLTSRIIAGTFEPTADPTSRITKDAVSAYIRDLKEQVAPQTVRGYIAALRLPSSDIAFRIISFCSASEIGAGAA